MRLHRANEIVNACSLFMSSPKQKMKGGDITYESVLGMRPTKVSELKYNNGTITAKITDSAACTEVKNKLDDKVSGDFSRTTSALTVTFEQVKKKSQYYFRFN